MGKGWKKERERRETSQTAYTQNVKKKDTLLLEEKRKEKNENKLFTY